MTQKEAAAALDIKTWELIVPKLLGWKTCWNAGNSYLSSGDNDGRLQVVHIAAKTNDQILSQIVELIHSAAHPETPAEAQGRDWMPIETAPRDWSDVIVYVPDSEENSDVMQGYYSCGDGGEDHWLSSRGEKIDPTHWMPLPAAPSHHTEGGEWKRR